MNTHARRYAALLTLALAPGCTIALPHGPIGGPSPTVDSMQGLPADAVGDCNCCETTEGVDACGPRCSMQSPGSCCPLMGHGGMAPYIDPGPPGRFFPVPVRPVFSPVPMAPMLAPLPEYDAHPYDGTPSPLN